MKIVLDIEETKKLKHKDVIVYDQTKKRWVAMDKSEFLKDVFLDINKLRNDNSFNTDGVMQKSYIIDSEKLLEFINENT